MQACRRTFNLGRRDRNAVVWLQNVVRRDWLAIDSDEVTGCFSAASSIEESVHGCAVFDFNVVSEPSSVIIDVEDFQSSVFR